MFKRRSPAPGIWRKPENAHLLPEFMQEAMDALRSLAVYFGLPAVTAFFLLSYGGESFKSLPRYYIYALAIIFKRQHIFYLIHLIPALIVRYVFAKRFKILWALTAAVSFNVAAFLILYPAAPFPNIKMLKDIAIYVSVCPCLMTYFTLRINRLRFSGACVIAVFLGLLCWGFWAEKNLP